MLPTIQRPSSAGLTQSSSKHARENSSRVRVYGKPYEILETSDAFRGRARTSARWEDRRDTRRPDRSRSPIRSRLERYDSSSLGQHTNSSSTVREKKFLPFKSCLAKRLDELTKSSLRHPSNGKDFVQWSHALSNSLKNAKKLSPHDIKTFIDNLCTIKNLIPDWDIQCADNFYFKLSRMGFFNRTNSLDQETEYKVQQLHSVLIKKLAKDLPKISLTDDSLSDFISLLRFASENSEIKGNEADWPNFINTLNSCILKCQSDYKWFQFYFIPQNLNKFAHIKDCQQTISLVLDRCLFEMAKQDLNKIPNVELAKLLTHYAKIFSSLSNTNHLSETMIANLKIFISKIDFTENATRASVGFFSIMTCIVHKQFILEGIIAEKLNECILCIYDNKEKLSTNDSLYSVRSFLKYFNEFGEAPSHIKELFDLCIDNLSANEAKFHFNQLATLLTIVKDACEINLPVLQLYKSIQRLMLAHKEKLIKSNPELAHNHLTRFSSMLHSIKLANKNLDFFKLNELFNELIKISSNKILNADLIMQLNDFNTLLRLAIDSFHADSKVRDLFRDLQSKLKSQISKMNSIQVIRFLNYTFKLGNLIKTNKEEMLNLFINHSNEVIQKEIPANKRISFIWSILAFYGKQEKELAFSEIILLKNIAKKIYDSISDKQNLKTANTQTLHMVENWLALPITKNRVEDSSHVSFMQKKAYDILKHELKENNLETVKIKNEFSDENYLPPCDIGFPKQKIVIEIQGGHHYLDKERKYKTGSTLLKAQLYKDAGYHVFEVPVNHSKELQYEFKDCIQKIVQILKEPKRVKFS